MRLDLLSEIFNPGAEIRIRDIGPMGRRRFGGPSGSRRRGRELVISFYRASLQLII